MNNKRKKKENYYDTHAQIRDGNNTSPSNTYLVTRKQLGQFHAVPYHLLSSTTVTQNAVGREGPQHRLAALSCRFVSQQRSVCSPWLKVVSHCGGTRALWPTTATQRAGAPEKKGTSGSLSEYLIEFSALATTFAKTLEVCFEQKTQAGKAMSNSSKTKEMSALSLCLTQQPSNEHARERSNSEAIWGIDTEKGIHGKTFRLPQRRLC